MTSALADRLGFRLEAAVPEVPPVDVYRDHVGITPQKQPGLCVAGVAVLRGRIPAAQLSRVAEFADRFGSGDVRTTTMQNVLIANVAVEAAPALVAALDAAGLPLLASPFWRGTVACTGSEFCTLALTETKGFAQWLVDDLESRLPGFEEHVKIHVTGCPNSCGQHWIADIGLEGKKTRVDRGMVDAYYFRVGGAVGKHQSIARPVGFRTPADEVPAAIERLLRAYLERRVPGESFRAFSARHADEELRAFLAGAPVDGVARDVAPGSVPHGVEGLTVKGGRVSRDRGVSRSCGSA